MGYMSELCLDWWSDHAGEGEDGKWYLYDDEDIIGGPCETESELADKYYDKCESRVTDNLADAGDNERKRRRENFND